MFEDGTVYREESRPEVYVIFGRAKFWIPSPDVLEQHYGGWGAVQLVPDGALAAVPSIPRDGTVLRELSSAPVYVVQGGLRHWIPSPEALELYGGWGAVREVPDGALAAIPESPAIADLSRLYGNLRSVVLSRHFALGKHARRNLFNEANVLEPPALTGTDFLKKSEAEQLVLRWRIGDHTMGNPLMLGGQLLTCLAVEHELGQPDAAKIIRLALQSLASLYKFSSDHFDGYIIRWDAAASDDWEIETSEGQVIRRYCRQFLLAQDRRHLYCTPFDDPRYLRPLNAAERARMSQDEVARYDAARDTCVRRYRFWEPSQDELIGLVMGYHMVYQLVDDQGIRAEVERQVRNLGDYLAAHGYLLVRPCGGFAAQGAAGALPAFEFPFGRVFEHITGDPFPARVDFEGALRLAKVWPCLEGPYNWATAGALAGTITLGAILPRLTTALNVALAGFGLLLAQVPLNAVQAARAWQFYEHRDCFDVYERLDKIVERPSAGEFPLAYGLMQVSPPRRFELFMWFVGHRHPGDPPAFAPWLGLMGFGDHDTRVRDAYVAWLAERRQHPELDGAWHPSEQTRNSAFASAIAVLLDAGSEDLGGGKPEEAYLVDLLRGGYDEFKDVWQYDFPVAHQPAELDAPAAEKFRPTLHFMTGLALAWLHAKRRAAQGTPVATPGFPAIPDHSLWPPVAVPASVIDEAKRGALALPEDALQRGRTLETVQLRDYTLLGKDGHPRPLRGADLFIDDAPPAKPAEIDPVLAPPAEEVELYNKRIVVRESDFDVDTGIVLRFGDTYEMQASGSIWAGVLGTGWNGPEGWNRSEHDTKFPLHGEGARPYSLLGKLDNYFFIGVGRGPECYLGAEERRLYLRINDDGPGNGDGSFTCHVIVRGARRQDAAFVAQSVPTVMQPGQRYEAVVTMRNTGGSTWTPDGATPYRLGSQFPQDNLRWGVARVDVPAPIPPGAEAAFRFTVTAPTASAIHDFQWRMVQESVEWFGAYTTRTRVTVAEPGELVTVPDVREMVRGEAEAAIRAAGLVPRISGTGTWVLSQSPAAGSPVPRRSKVTLHLMGGPLP
jgi:hypothetical protein